MCKCFKLQPQHKKAKPWCISVKTDGKNTICCECWSYKRNKRQSSHHCSLINIFRLCASDVIALVQSKLNVMRRKTWVSLSWETMGSKNCSPGARRAIATLSTEFCLRERVPCKSSTDWWAQSERRTNGERLLMLPTTADLVNKEVEMTRSSTTPVTTDPTGIIPWLEPWGLRPSFHSSSQTGRSAQ